MQNEEQILAAYLTLECEFGCTEEELKSSYRQLVKVWHPDRFETDSKLKQKATEKMKLINEAYQFLLRYFEEPERLTRTPHSARTSQSTTEQENAGPKEAEFVFKLKEELVRRFGPSETGEFFFLRDVESVLTFDGIWLTKEQKSFHTKPVGPDEDFESAAKDSMSFSSEPEQGAESEWDFGGGLQHPDGNARKFSFPDGSWVMIWNTSSNILEHEVLLWRNSRTGLNEIKEDFQFFKGRQNWKQCVLFGQKAIDIHGQSSWGWIHRSYALHCLSMTKSALWALERAVKQFPKETLMFYNLACYSAQLGEAKAAKDWLKTVFKLARNEGSFDRFNKLAMSDSDLSPIRSAIPQLALASSISRFF